MNRFTWTVVDDQLLRGLTPYKSPYLDKGDRLLDAEGRRLAEEREDTLFMLDGVKF